MGTPEHSLIALLLAAGQSSRFGSTKALHAMSDGRTLLEHSLDAYKTRDIDVKVLVNSRDHVIRTLCERLCVDALGVVDAEHGMAESLKTGVAYADSSHAHGAMIGLADMPYLKASMIDDLWRVFDREYEEGRPLIIAPRYIGAGSDDTVGQLGHPVIFSRELFAEFSGLQGDVGAKGIIRAHKEYLIELPTTDKACIIDIDRPSDLLI